MKSRRIVLIILLAVILAAAGVIVFNMIRGDRGSVYTGDLYFFNESSTAIEAESRQIHYHGWQDLAEEVIKGLMKGPEDSKHRRIIEKKTRLLSIDGVETGNVLVNFSGEFITGDDRKDILAVYAVVKSLCATNNIYSVKLVIEGRDITASDGSIIGYLSDEDINLPTDTTSSEMRSVRLYFPKKSDNMLAQEVRSIRVTDQQPLAQYIINELIKGPENEELDSSLSKDTVLLSVETSNNICFVNFRASFLDKNSGSAEKEKLAIFSIVDSLTELDAINRVQFLMDGKRVDMFGNINISGMFGRDESIIDK